jgi:DNA-directed RNA polymerase specialized sigma54-like protein
MGRHVLIAAEKMLIVKAHNYFMQEKADGRAGTSRHVRRRVADCLDFSESTVERVITHWHKHEDPTFTAGVAPANRGRPPRSSANSFALEIRTHIRTLNAEQKPVTARVIVAHLKEYSIDCCEGCCGEITKYNYE